MEATPITRRVLFLHSKPVHWNQELVCRMGLPVGWSCLLKHLAADGNLSRIITRGICIRKMMGTSRQKRKCRATTRQWMEKFDEFQHVKVNRKSKHIHTDMFAWSRFGRQYSFVQKLASANGKRLRYHNDDDDDDDNGAQYMQIQWIKILLQRPNINIETR